MSVPTSHLPLQPQPAARPEPPKAASLDERIRQAELRLIDREEALRKRVAAFGGQLREAVRPRKLIAPLIGVGAGVVTLVWLLRGSGAGARNQAVKARGAMPATAAAARAPRGGGSATWVRLLGLAWPLFPAHWRAKISPATAATAGAIGLPLLEKLFASDPPEPLDTVPHVDLYRWAGTWHEIARLPAPFEWGCDGQPNATYVPRAGRIEVINRCRGSDGSEKVARGEARVVPGTGNSQLEVSLWPSWLRFLSMAWADYWIVHVDDHYRVAIVGHPSRRFLWLLARERRIPASLEAELVDRAAMAGFKVQRLKFADRR